MGRDPAFTKWQQADPATVGIDPARLQATQRWLAAQDVPYRVVIVRSGSVVAQWNQGVTPQAQQQLASAAKSIYSCALALAIEEGKIKSADDLVVDYYPQMMAVPRGTGPKAGRYAFPANRAITFRQLISNTSGYMKPDEAPGEVFHYQTYGMNILCHAIATAYGLWDPERPDESPGLQPLLDRWLREPLGANWSYYRANFSLQPAARLGIFGYYEGIKATALDMARLGWLWRQGGRWGRRQVIPASWMQRATTPVDVAAYAADTPFKQAYGLGFWTNQAGTIWPDLPRDAFAASGAGRQHIWVCPSLDLVVVQSPGIFAHQGELNATILRSVTEAVR